MDRVYTKSAENRVQIKLMGRFELQLDGQRIDQCLSRSKRGRALVCFLALHYCEVMSYGEIYDAIARGKKSKEKDNSVKVLACRTRNILAQADPALADLIVTDAGGYSWNADMTESIDVCQLEQLCREIRKMQVCTEDYIRKVQELLTLYKPRLLPEFTEESWAVGHTKRLQDLFSQTIAGALPVLQEAEEWNLVHQLSAMREPEEPAGFEGYRSTLVLLDKGDGSHHRPASALNAHAADNRLLRLVEDTRIDLIAYQDKSGALLCDYDTFRAVYEHQRRSLDRYRLEFYLVGVRVNVEQKPPFQTSIADVMRILGTALKTKLEQGDTAARRSALEYIVLLQEQAEDAVHRKMGLVQEEFEKHEETQDATVSYIVTPMDGSGQQAMEYYMPRKVSEI